MSQGGSVRGVHDEHHSFQGKPGKQAKFQGHIVQVEAGASSLQKSFFSHLSQHFQRQESPLFSADARHTQYLVNDVLGFGRNFLQIFGLNSNVQNLLGGSGGAALGVTGLEVLQKGEQDLELANRALDKKAEESANLTWKIGASEMAMGGFGAAFRGLSTASNLEGVNSSFKASSALGQSTFAFGQIGSVFSSIWYAFLGFSVWNSLKEVWRIEKGIETANLKEFFKKELDFNPKVTLKFLEEKFLEEHPECGSKSDNDEKLSLLWGKEEDFKTWCEEVLSNETKALAKDFLESINPYPDKTYDFDQAATTMLQTPTNFQGITILDGFEDLKELGLSKVALIGLESLHRNRLAIARAKVESAIGSEALRDVFDLIEGKKGEEEVLASVKKGLQATKIEDYVVAAFIVLGVAVTLAGTVGACIACPPLGLVLACAIVSVFINVIISYVDWQSLMKNWDAPVGKLEDRVNTLKLLTGIGCIAGICLLSASTLGTAPVAIALIITSSMVIASIWRHVHTRQKRAQEKEALASMNALIDKLKESRDKDISEADKAKKEALEMKIQKIILRKLQYTHKSILENINNKEEWIKRITHISEQDINKIREDISLWQDSENAIIKELQDAFKLLDAIPMRDRSWKELFMQFFSDAPHFRRIFPEEGKVV